jgi:hypothetical protein
MWGGRRSEQRNYEDQNGDCTVVAEQSLKSQPRLSAAMSDRLLSVNAYTTLDLLEGEAEAHEFTESAYAVVNATAPRKNPDHVKLEMELDNAELEHLPAHADRVRLTPEQARTIAADLEKYADKVEANLADEE